MSIILWCFVLVLQYSAEEVNCQLHVEVRNYLNPFSSISDTHVTHYEFDEPELSPLNPKWFNFYPYANVEMHFELFGETTSNRSGYLYEILDCDEIPIAGYTRLLSSHSLWFAFISNYSQNCHNDTVVRLKSRGYYMLFAYNDDGDQTISQEDKDSGFPIAILTENHALDLLSYYDNVDYNRGITSRTPVIFIVRSEKDRALNTFGSVILYIIAGCFGLCIFGVLFNLCYLGFCDDDCRDDTSANNIELRNISRRNSEERVSRENGGSASQVQSVTTTEIETTINMENTTSASRVQSRDNGRLTSTADKKQVRKYDPKSDSTQACRICLADFKVGDDVRCLDCNANHIFHSCCLDRWSRQGQKSCPLCRAKYK